ncbi:MAG: thiamine phosphate synthase [Polyangiales bacterium]|nr:thiamine phosphate synthase [Sandaracinaceae bacterium]
MRGGFYAIVDPAHCGGRNPVDVAEQVLAGGAEMLQLRMKRGTDRERAALARALRARARAAAVPFIVNDRADLALLVDADGLHLGQDDLSVADARVLLGARQLGVSTHDAEQARQAVRDGADVIGFGPVFDTQTKERPDPTVGLAALAEVCRSSPVPVVAIGGLTPARAREAYAVGATWVAAISAVCEAPDVVVAARAFAAPPDTVPVPRGEPA